jgi:hypothetical protein
MQKSVLIEIVQALQKKEVREIQKWLQSPAHNQRDDVQRLFDYLTQKPSKADIKDDFLDKEHAWKVVFPGKPYDDAYMRQVMYFLLKVIEEYLAFTEFSNNKVQFNLYLTRIYRERKLEKASKQAYRISTETLENQPLRDGYYLLQRFMLQKEYGQWTNVIANAAPNLQETSDALERLFLAEKINLALTMLAHKTVNQAANYDQGMLDFVLNYTKERNLLDEPAIGLYYYAFMAVSHQEEESYFAKLELLIQEHMPRFMQYELRTLYIAALNYCVVKINQGQDQYSRRAFELYRKGLEKHILIENNTIPRYTFGNAVGAAVRIGEFDWAEKFVHDFQGFLNEKERNSMANFNLARIYYAKGDYNRSQTLLTQFDYDYMFFNIIAKTMLLKIYYEKDEFDAFESLLESMRIYLQRKEALDQARKVAYTNMISLMKKLLNLNPYSKAQKAKLHEQVIATNPLMEREWLLKQLEGK